MKKAHFALLPLLFLLGCGSNPPIRTEKSVDINRFMGDWYVIANIPTFIEEGAHNAVESYKLNDDGSIETTFTFNKDSFDGVRKVYNPTGYIYDKDSNAVWGMQFLWPFKSDYRIVYLDQDYQLTIVGRLKRDYVWVMARKPYIPDADYQELVSIIKQQGYDISQLQKVPQKW